jgi:ABC-type nitrate/sulfonate/bicarbonate transport system substrate-binding protein
VAGVVQKSERAAPPGVNEMAMTRPISRSTALRIAGAVAAAGIARPAFAQPAARSLAVGLTARTASDWGVYIADKGGFFAANGLKPDITVIGSSAACAQQLTAGSIDVGEVSTTQLIEAVLGGAPIVAILNRTNNAPYAIIAKKGIASIAQLKGKTIIVGGPNDITLVFMNTVLAAYKLTQDDVTYTFAGGTGERFAALMSGTVDAAILLPPFSFRASDAGYPVLDNVENYYKAFPFDTFSVRTDWVKKNPDLAVSYVRSILQALAWLYDPANRAKAIAILADATNASPDDASKTYDFFVTKMKFYNRTGVMTAAELDVVIDALIKTAQLKPPPPDPNRFFDNSYVEKATASLHH